MFASSLAILARTYVRGARAATVVGQAGADLCRARVLCLRILVVTRIHTMRSRQRDPRPLPTNPSNLQTWTSHDPRPRAARWRTLGQTTAARPS